MEYSIVLFFSNNYSIWLARLLKKAGIDRKMIPIPKHLNYDCGYCVRVRRTDLAMVKKVMRDNNITYDKIEHV